MILGLIGLRVIGYLEAFKVRALKFVQVLGLVFGLFDQKGVWVFKGIQGQSFRVYLGFGLGRFKAQGL